MPYLCCMSHETYMRRCLQLAKIGLPTAAPNPSVGAILVSNNQIIGEGYTSPYGGAHGEVNCIEDCKRRMGKIPSDAVLYVSLEPCSHFGKTPPCSNLIIEEKIQTVVVACTDINPLVAGKGIQKLRDAGIRVIENVLEDEARELNKSFFQSHKTKRPFITLKWAQTAKGYFAPAAEKQFWITNQKSKLFVHMLRRNHMAILVGSRTARIDNPKLTTRLIQGKNPLRIVLQGDEPMDTTIELLTDNEETLVFGSEATNLEFPKEWIQLTKNQAPLPQILNALYERNIQSLLVEGGAYTLQQFIDADLWDEAYVLIGNKELKEGKLAPRLESKMVKSFTIFGDKVHHFKNVKNDLVTA